MKVTHAIGKLAKRTGSGSPAFNSASASASPPPRLVWLILRELIPLVIQLPTVFRCCQARRDDQIQVQIRESSSVQTEPGAPPAS